MIKKKKFRLLWPDSNCCLKKFIDLDNISKYGSIIVLIIMILSQVFNIIVQKSSYEMAFLSMIVNTFFLVSVLSKLEIIKMSILEKYINNILKFMIFIFILNFLGYLTSTSEIHNYVFAPISFFGAYFISLLLLK
jgi:uncharacterized membrane protein